MSRHLCRANLARLIKVAPDWMGVGPLSWAGGSRATISSRDVRKDANRLSGP